MGRTRKKLHKIVNAAMRVRARKAHSMGHDYIEVSPLEVECIQLGARHERQPEGIISTVPAWVDYEFGAFEVREVEAHAMVRFGPRVVSSA